MAKREFVHVRDRQTGKVRVVEVQQPSRAAARSESGRHGDYVIETVGDRVKDAAAGAVSKALGRLFR